MTDQRRIIALNNQGVRLLQQKNHLQANQVLLQSLHKLKETLKRQRVPSGVYEKLPLVEDDCSEDRPSCFATVPLDLPSSSSASSLPIFDRAFLFLPAGPSPQNDPTSSHNRDGSAAVILYNLAVTQQTRAVHHLNSSSKAKAALSQALRMYTWALSALQHWDRHSTVHRGCHLLRVATLHNMAAAQAVLGQTAAARHSFECLQTVLGPCKPYLERRDIQFFAANLLVVVVLCQDGSRGNDDTSGLTRTTSSLLGPAAAAAA